VAQAKGEAFHLCPAVPQHQGVLNRYHHTGGYKRGVLIYFILFLILQLNKLKKRVITDAGTAFDPEPTPWATLDKGVMCAVLLLKVAGASGGAQQMIAAWKAVEREGELAYAITDADTFTAAQVPS
jgi:hypothetical protein